MQKWLLSTNVRYTIYMMNGASKRMCEYTLSGTSVGTPSFCSELTSTLRNTKMYNNTRQWIVISYYPVCPAISHN